MRTQIINTATVLFAVFMLSSCDKESLVPISDVTQKAIANERESDAEKTFYVYEVEDEKTPIKTRMAIQSDDSALQRDEDLAGYDDPEGTAKTSADEQLGKKYFGADAFQSIQTVESKEDDADLSNKDDETDPNTIKVDAERK